jgi:hypothetical protein
MNRRLRIQRAALLIAGLVCAIFALYCGLGFAYVGLSNLLKPAHDGDIWRALISPNFLLLPVLSFAASKASQALLARRLHVGERLNIE